MAHVIKQTKTLPSVVLIQEKLATSVLLFGRNNFITWATVSYFLKSHFWPVEYSPFQKSLAQFWLNLVWILSKARIQTEGGSPGLVVIGVDSCFEGCGFKSLHRLLDGHLSHLFVVKIGMFVWKDKIKRK